MRANKMKRFTEFVIIHFKSKTKTKIQRKKKLKHIRCGMQSTKFQENSKTKIDQAKLNK